MSMEIGSFLPKVSSLSLMVDFKTHQVSLKCKYKTVVFWFLFCLYLFEARHHTYGSNSWPIFNSSRLSKMFLWLWFFSVAFFEMSMNWIVWVNNHMSLLWWKLFAFLSDAGWKQILHAVQCTSNFLLDQMWQVFI